MPWVQRFKVSAVRLIEMPLTDVGLNVTGLKTKMTNERSIAMSRQTKTTKLVVILGPMQEHCREVKGEGDMQGR